MRWHWFWVLMSCMSFYLIHTNPSPFTKEELRELSWIEKRHNDLVPLTWLEIQMLVKSHPLYPLEIYKIHKDIESQLDKFRDWKIKNQLELDKKVLLAKKPLEKAQVVYEEFIMYEETYMDFKKKK